MRRLPAVSFVVLTLASSLFADPAPRPTGVLLDPAAAAHTVGNFPLAVSVAPEGDRVALLLCGYLQQGIQIVATDGRVLQTIDQPSAFVGLAFAPDGKSLWASGGNEDAVYRYSWRNGVATADGRIELAVKRPKHDGMRYPAGIAFSHDGHRLYVAENLSDTLAVVDVASGRVLQRLLTGRYPYGVAVAKNGDVYVSAWGEDFVSVYRRQPNALLRHAGRITVARHPAAMLLDDKSHRLFVTSPSVDRIAVVDLRQRRVSAMLSDPPPAGPEEGSTPNALALSPDGARLFVAEADANSVAVFGVKGKTAKRPQGRIPVEAYPSALAIIRDRLLIVNAKGHSGGPNPRGPQPATKLADRTQYTLGQIDGSIMLLPLTWDEKALASMSKRVAAANHWTSRPSAAKYPPFKHVIYIIKENRTYDQILGDLKIGDGDPSLVYFPREVSPNHHALAERFGLFDRFMVNADVSAQGHNWSTAAFSTDYTEKTVPSEYSSRGRSYDYEGSNRGQIVDEDDDVAAPATGYLWDLALRKGISLRNYGEFVVEGKEIGGEREERRIPTRRALMDVTNTDYPAWDLDIPDQKRADAWIRDLEKYTAAKSMPSLQILRLPNDHTAGAKAGAPTPRAYVADNDLALGRIVEALSRSPFWKDSVVFVLEDDAQNGPDHVDSHRSPLLVISPYNHSGVVSRFANTTDVLATIEEILGLASLSQFDFYGHPLVGVFSAEADLRPYEALQPAVDRNEKNPPATPAAKASEKLDFTRPDAADDAELNRILWAVVKGNNEMPPARRAPAGR